MGPRTEGRSQGGLSSALGLGPPYCHLQDAGAVGGSMGAGAGRRKLCDLGQPTYKSAPGDSNTLTSNPVAAGHVWLMKA